MKWLNRIAQGFSPGDHGPSENRPEGATEHYLPPRSVTVSNALAADPCAQPICRSPLQGDVKDANYPGLKPWAILFCHFMADPAVQARPRVFPMPAYNFATIICSSLTMSAENLRIPSANFSVAIRSSLSAKP